MVKSVNNFAIPKLKDWKYLSLEVIMHVERENVLKFMFSLNKETRTFLYHYFNTLNNGFINEGLIIHSFNGEFNFYD